METRDLGMIGQGVAVNSLSCFISFCHLVHSSNFTHCAVTFLRKESNYTVPFLDKLF